MPVSPSYPGIYIEELPSTSHTIAAAPTSIAVFVGYTHPFKTPSSSFNKAIELFSFTDYQREFGGFYNGALLDDNVAQAVNQFFINGGGQAYVVGLKPVNYLSPPSGSPPSTPAAVAVASPSGTAGGVTFAALEPTDLIPMTVSIDNVSGPTSAPNTIADITITYGTRTPEVYRHVTVAGTNDPDYITTRLAGSSYVKVTGTVPAAFPTSGLQAHLAQNPAIPTTANSTFAVSDFDAVFATDSDLDKLPIFNILVLPGVTDSSVLSTALAFAERKRAFMILDPPPNSVAGQTADASHVTVFDYMKDTAPKSPNGALYFPYLKTSDPLSGNPISLPPSGYVAGIFARTDNNRGVWKAPAGLETTILNTTGVVDDGRMNDMRQGVLNLAGINCLRTFPGIGTVTFGARTLVSANVAYEQWKYVPVRRMALFIEQTLYRALTWAVFEPNDEPLWIALRTSVENFMLSLFSNGAFQGSKPSEAFLVRCDKSTTTQTDINNGVVNIIVAFAPLKPAEFVIVKIAQLAGQVQ
ncbi:MAG TPA: phage tail sheath subtilisin-like domain-containing protein [Candidatus Limnocylindrales bacterium]|nr:phage tail sheath subtilisin-like domain-containing protein [Candidatus Limnocylindrales bacterium]